MEFSNVLFLYLLLPAAVLTYHLLPGIWRKNAALTIMSLLLYAMGQPVYVPLLVGMCYVNYRLALRIEPEERGTLLLPVVLNVAVLGGFQYLTLLLDSFGLGTGGFRILPAGLWVMTFSAVSYLVDVYRGRTEPEEEFSKLLLYFLMFPKLLQGPIVPYCQISHQLRSRRHDPRAVFEGLRRFCFGLAKKVLLADACGRLMQQLIAMEADYTLVGIWFGAVLFLFRIYYDFSGCCDMAIGLGRVFGFRYCENFNRPYMALSVTDFCGRWHMSLGNFFRNYVYEPLGGKELGKLRQAMHMLICCVAVGLWHSAGLNYLIWAAYLGGILALELYLKKRMNYWPDWLCRCWTLWLLLFGWILFSHESLEELKNAMLAILGYGGFGVAGLGRLIFSSFPLLLICGLGCTNLPVYIKRIFAGICGVDPRNREQEITVLRVVYAVVSLGVMLWLLWMCTISLTTLPSLPSIYGKF